MNQIITGDPLKTFRVRYTATAGEVRTMDVVAPDIYRAMYLLGITKEHLLSHEEVNATPDPDELTIEIYEAAKKRVDELGDIILSAHLFTLETLNLRVAAAELNLRTWREKYAAEERAIVKHMAEVTK